MKSHGFPPEYAAQMCEALTNRLLNELTRLEAPPEVFELVYGLSFFSLFGKDNDPALEADFPAVLKSSINAMVQTGGL